MIMENAIAKDVLILLYIYKYILYSLVNFRLEFIQCIINY